MPCPDCEKLTRELARAHEVVKDATEKGSAFQTERDRLAAERERGTAALREAFGQDLWRLGHPAYVVVHLREEYAKALRLWKESEAERDRLLKRIEELERERTSRG